MTGPDPLTDAFDNFANAADHTMWIVTVAADGERSGCLVGFGTQGSIEPRRFLVCLSKVNHTYGVAARADALAIHLVPAERQDLAGLFGGETGDEVDKFATCEWRDGPGGVPLLDGCPVLVGDVVARWDAGDHVGFVVAPTEVSDLAVEHAVVTYASARHIVAGNPTGKPSGRAGN